jgi:tripartite-type tricarboxylate transporter receptor subunit TctC
MVRFVRPLIIGLAILASACNAASADDYPNRPIRWIVGFAAGGPTDLVARIMAQYLSDKLGQQVVVENRGGAGGNLAAQAAITSPPDGYTLLFVAPNNAINTTLYKSLPFDFLHDIAPVAGIMRVPNVMEVNPDVPAKTIPEFIAYAKANPSKINMASSGVGTSVHMAGELFQAMTGTKLVHVPYRGSAPAFTDLFTNRVQIIFDNMPASLEHIRAGKLRPLGVTTAMRSTALPDTPAVAETIPGYEASSWYGVGVPAGTPPAAVARLNAEINAALADPKMKARLEDLGGILMPGTPAEFGAFIRAETEKWAKVVEFSGAKAE